MDTILFLTFLVRYVAFLAALLIVGALAVATVYAIVRESVAESDAVAAAALQTNAHRG